MKYAGFWVRYMAVMVDALIMLIPMILLNMAIPYVAGIILTFLYYPVFESSSARATPGKYWLGLRVVAENGQRLSFNQAMVRQLMRYVSGAILFFGYLMQPFTKKRQTLHDIVSGAIVIDVSEDGEQANPDWIQVWVKQMRSVLQMDQGEPETIDVVNTSRQSSNESTTNSAMKSSATVEAIEKLYELYKSGALTEDEFQSKKSELLKQV
jgi:uncharacterized RDD family membrane protein YckC